MQITPTPLPPILPRILLLLTFVTGIVDSVSVLALGRVFTANMTGNIVVIGIAMGLRNATVRRLAVPDLTTTVLTLTVTGIAADSSLAGGNNPRVGYRLASIFLMLLGAASGAQLLRFGPAAPLLLSGMLGLVSVALLSSETQNDTSLKPVNVRL